MHIPAKADYAVRALVSLAAADRGTMTAEELAKKQGLSVKFLESILNELRRGGILISQRGAGGGYRLSRNANQINLAEIMRQVDGPLAEVRGLRPELTSYEGDAQHLQKVWVAVRASLRNVLENVTIAQVAKGNLPRSVQKYVDDPDSWLPH